MFGLLLYGQYSPAAPQPAELALTIEPGATLAIDIAAQAALTIATTN